MHQPPTNLSDQQVLDRVRTRWCPDVTAVRHLAVGFGAWHWRAEVEGTARFFVTLDPPLWHTAESAEATYAAAAHLARTLDVVHACLPTRAGRFTSRLDQGWLSCTPWLEGHRPLSVGPEAVQALHRLHASRPPPAVLTWEPTVAADLVDELTAWVAGDGWAGPHGEVARAHVRAGLSGAVERGLTTYLRLRQGLDHATYVPTHGEPGAHNQWRTEDGRLLLLDWETLRFAPRERDLLDGYHERVEHDPDLLHLFRLEWRLSEVRSYAQWLRGPHEDDTDTRTALDGLRAELAALTG